MATLVTRKPNELGDCIHLAPCAVLSVGESILRTAIEEVGRITGASEVSIQLSVGAPSAGNGGGNGYAE